MLIKYMGEGSGAAGWGLAAFFGSVSLIPGFIAFPFAYLLWKKGCSVRNIFIYMGAYSTIKIPMLTFEIGFMGLKFSLLRTIVFLPLFILTGFLMEQYLKGKTFRIREPSL